MHIFLNKVLQSTTKWKTYSPKQPISDFERYLYDFVIPKKSKIFIILDHVDFSILKSQEKVIVSRLMKTFTSKQHIDQFSIILISSNEFVSEYYKYTTIYIPCFSFEKFKFILDKHLYNSLNNGKPHEFSEYSKEFNYKLLYDLCNGNCSMLFSFISRMQKDNLNLSQIINLYNNNVFLYNSNNNNRYLKQHYKNLHTLRDLKDCEFLLSILFTESQLCSNQLQIYFNKEDISNQVYKKVKIMQKMLIINKISIVCDVNDRLHTHFTWYSPLNKYALDSLVSNMDFFSK